MRVTLAILAVKALLVSVHAAQLAFGSDGEDADSARLAADQSLLWGTYRPGLYFGLKPRHPNSLMTGVMWYGANDYKGFESKLFQGWLDGAVNTWHGSTEAGAPRGRWLVPGLAWLSQPQLNHIKPNKFDGCFQVSGTSAISATTWRRTPTPSMTRAQPRSR